ncbi:MAG: hypothetical protein OXR82_16845 [Gammaproteobacteria bacterium]|nr:hypothetical protein [Gammaproteobacteria bacterium]
MLMTLRTLILLLLVSATPVLAQMPETLLDNFRPREVGPAFMGGRIVDLAVYEEDPAIFYAATASGGLLKTVNGGNSWENVFDRQSTVSIGDVAINPADPSVIWVGTGEANNRQSSSWGDGIYKSTDGGRSWQHMGLRESHHIGRIIVNPQDTDIVYVAALGHLWGANPERGVFMTVDGGQNWQHVLSLNDDTGAVDLAIDPANPKVLYAAAYQRRRSAWGFNGGGPHGGIYKTVDGGRTWRKLGAGLPEGVVGRIGLDIFRGNSNVVFATVEHEEGGIFRSADKGESWTKVNDLNPRPMYYSQIRIDPNDEKRIYVLGTELSVSDDAGRTFFEGDPEVHSDHHALWINPANSRHLIDGNDGGVWVSRDRSRSWEHLNNYAMGQFYHVTVDMQQPYRIYGGMQDNATWGGPSMVRDRQGIANEHWTQMLACDGMYVAVDPSDGRSIYTNCQNGRIVRYDQATGERKAIQPQPVSSEDTLRWNWTTPIVVSPHDPTTLFTGANKLYRSTDRGHSWTAISEDLTGQVDRDELTLMGVRGEDITLSRNDGVSSFGNITALAESPQLAGLIYVGTDDGKVHVTRDGGTSWTELTDRISGVPEMIYVSRLRPSAFSEGTVYVSFDGHRSDDFRPYVYVSNDHGASWRSIASNLPTGSVYVVEEDPRNPNLLYLGTEFGLFASIDQGLNWTRWNNLPTVAVYDLVVHPRDNDLVLGTHGRSIIVYDDISPLQQLNDAILASGSHLFDMRPGTQFIPNENGWFLGGRSYRAENPEAGTNVHYYLSDSLDDDVEITVRDAAGTVVRELTGPKDAGIHRVVWDLRAEPSGPPATGLAGALNLTDLGPFVLPGEYSVRLSAGGQDHTKTVRVVGDPLVEMTDADRRELHAMLLSLTGMQRTTESAADVIGKMTEEVQRVSETLAEHPSPPDAVMTSAEAVEEEIADLRTKLTGAEGGGFGSSALSDRIDRLKAALMGSQSLPTAIQSDQFELFRAELNDLVGRVNTSIDSTLPDFYRQLSDHGIHPIPSEPISVRSLPPLRPSP